MTSSAIKLNRDRSTGVSHSTKSNNTGPSIEGTKNTLSPQKHQVKLRKRTSARHPLRDLRIAANMTLEDLSKTTGMSPSYLSRLESGSRRLNEDIISKLSSALGCAPSDLLVQGKASSILKTPSHQAPQNTNQIADLPVLKITGESDDLGAITQKTNDRIHRPSDYIGIKTAFGCRLDESYWSPRYEKGETLLMNPMSPLKDGCSVFVKTKSNKVYIGTYKETRSDNLPTELTLITSYSSEQKEITFPLKDIEASKITGTLGA